MMVLFPTVLVFLLGVALGIFLRLDRWKVVEIEVQNVVDVVNCRSCNKLRDTVQRYASEAMAEGSSHWLPVIQVKGELVIDWQLMNVAKRVGRPRKPSKK